MTPIEPWARRGMVPKAIHVILTNLKEDHLMMLFINIKAVGNCGFSKEDFLMFSLQDFKLIYFSFNMEGIYFEAIADRQRLRYK